MDNSASQGSQEYINIHLNLNRSNYIHAFPNQLDCLDWIGLLHFATTDISEYSWLNRLQNGNPIPFTIPTKAKIQQNLFHLFFEKQNRKKQFANSGLYIGFPILFSLDEHGLKSIPIYLFNVDLKNGSGKEENWIITPSPANQAILNPLVAEIIDSEQLEALIQELPTQADNWQSFLEQSQEAALDWERFPQSKDWQLERGQRKIYPSAILGTFPSPERVSIKGSQFIEQDTLEPALHWRHHFAHLNLDPSQRAALNDLYGESLITICGKAGAGKKHLTQYLLINALSNGKKVLYITGNRSNITLMQKELEQLGLGQLSFWLQQNKNETALLFNLLKAGLPKDHPQAYSKDDLGLNMLIDELQQNKERLDAAFRACNRPTFGPFNWAQTVGLYLKSHIQGSKEILSTPFSGPELNFQIEEFQKLSQTIAKAQQLFEQLGTIRHPLRILNKNIFLSLSLEEARHHINSKLLFFGKQFEQLQQDFVGFFNEYHHHLNDYLFQFYQEQSAQIETISSSIQSKEATFGNDFLLTSDTSLRLYSGISSRIKSIREARKAINNDLQKLITSFKSPPNWQHEQPSFSSFKNIKSLKSWLENFKGQLESWWSEVPSFVQESTAQLNYQNALSTLKRNNDLLRLEASLDQTLTELNNAELLDTPQNQEVHYLPQRQQQIETVIDLLENIRLNLRDFDPFYGWYAFWLNQSSNQQALIQAIIRVKPDTWVSAFESWYLQELLQQKQVAQLPKEELIHSEFKEQQKKIQKFLSRQILLEWARRRDDAGKYLRKFIKSWEFQNLELGPVLGKEGKAITDFFPVLLSTPLSAHRILQEVDNNLFDLIIFDSAQYIDADIGLRLKRLSKQAIVIGDDSFVRGDAKEDLLEYYLEKEENPIHKLQYSHRYYPGNLWQLMAGKRITESAIQNFSLQLSDSEGQFNEELKINQVEANQLIEALLSTSTTPQRTYPSIGIVTTTIQQRNWIAQKLFSFKQRPKTLEGQLILQMERNGLGVYHLEELQGHRFDHLLFSTTLGKNAEQQLSKQIDYFNTPEGVRQLSELMATGSKFIHIFHSIPWNTLQQWCTQQDNAGFFLLSNYFLMIKSLQFRQADLQQEVIDRLLDWHAVPTRSSLNTPIYDEIILKLTTAQPELTIQQHYQSAHFELPLVIHPPSGSKKVIIAVVVDGFLSSYKASDQLWEIQQRENLKNNGIVVVPTWSVNWWKNADQSVKKLLAEINELWEVQA